MTRHRTTRPRRAFTLIEMLVVIAIIGVLAGISFPVLSAMQKDTDRATAVNTVSVAATTAQAYATRPVIVAIDPIPGNATNDPVRYSGTAAIFTHDNRIIIAENDITARATGSYPRTGATPPNPLPNPPLERLQDDGAGNLQVVESGETLPRHLNGFKDIVGLDVIDLPSDAGVVGITRTAAGGVPTLVRPVAPANADGYARWFAVWFNSTGQLIVGGEEDQFVYYSHDGGNIDVDYTDANNPDWLPSVVGVYTYSKSDLADAGLGTGSSDADLWNWLHTEKNGHLVLFLKQTGNSLRNARD